MSTVSIVRCDEYEKNKVYNATKEAISLANGLNGNLSGGKKVLLKINLLSSSKGPEEPVNTNPVVVRALVDFFQKDCGCEVYIGDSCGSIRTGSTNKAFRLTQIDKVADETGARLVNFDKDRYLEVKKTSGTVLEKFRMARTLKDVDIVVSVPKLKTHGLTKYTGAIKNMLGVIPGNGKKDVHVAAPKPTHFAEALVDIYEESKPHLTVMDGIIGMEGNGPNSGDPRKIGLILASADGVALDSVASRVIGFNPFDIPTIQSAHNRGLGIAEPSEISVKGESIEDVAIPDFKKPSGASLALIGTLLPAPLFARFMDSISTATSNVYEPNCTKCYECIKNCPVKAITATGTDAKARVDGSQCIGCFCCDEVCDYKAIEMKRTRLAKLLGVENT